MGKPDPPPGPDYEALLQITRENIASNEKLFDEYMTFARAAYADQDARADDFYQLTRREADLQYEIARSQGERYLELGVPVEDEYVEYLTDYYTPQKADEAAAKASADVAMASENARQAYLEELSRMGVSPGAANVNALNRRFQQEIAADQAAAATLARERMRDTQGAYLGEAVNVRAGMPAQSAQSLAAGVRTSQAGLNTAGAADEFGMNMYRQGFNAIGQRQDIATSGWGTANAIYGNQLRAYEMELANAQAPFALGANLAGTALGFAGTAFHDGGYVGPDAGPPVMAAPPGQPREPSQAVAVKEGEVVLPRETVMWHGLKHIKKLNEDAQAAIPDLDNG